MSNIFNEDLEIRTKLDDIICGREHSPQRTQQHQDGSIQTTHTDQHRPLTLEHPTAHSFSCQNSLQSDQHHNCPSGLDECYEI